MEDFTVKTQLDRWFFTGLFVPRTSQISLDPTRETAFTDFSCGSSNGNVLGMENIMKQTKIWKNCGKRLLAFTLLAASLLTATAQSLIPPSEAECYVCGKEDEDLKSRPIGNGN